MKQEGVIDKKLVEELMAIKGEARGMHLRNDADFVLKTKNQEGLKRLEAELRELGCPIDYQKIDGLGFYPIGLRAVSLLAIKKVFGWDDQKIKELCGFAANISLIARLYMRFFHSVAKISEQAPKMWREYFSEGELVVRDYNEKEKYVLLEVRNFELHPVFCRCLEGYLENLIKMIVIARKVESREIKCTFKGQPCHQFKITWE